MAARQGGKCEMLNSNHFHANGAQVADLNTALLSAEDLLENARWFREQDDSGYLHLSEKNKMRAYAYLNRAGELACVPLAQYYAETPSGIDLVWITYRPEVVSHSTDTDSAALIYLGSVDDLTETQARSRAIGW